MKHWGVLLVCGVMPLLAFADAKVSAFCEGNDDPSINQIRQSIALADAIIPQIPPEEDRYLDAEEKSLFMGEKPKIRGTERWEALTRRPLYYSWKLRAAIRPVVESLDQLRDSTSPLFYKNIETAKMYRAITGYRFWNEYVRELQTFLDKERFLQIDQGTRYRLFANGLAGNLALEQFMLCKLSKLDRK
jgi:hypothetical protein